MSERPKFPAKRCKNPTYCPECVVDEYGHNEEVNFTFYLYACITPPFGREAVCTKCGAVIPLDDH